MSKLIDALIIGGGPAGASAALLLARAGWTVALVEKKIFPRVKVCGEFISATSLPLIQELGVLDYYLEHAGPAIQRLAWFTENKIVTADMPIANNALSAWGRALGRDLLDTCLLKEAQSAGAKIWQPWRAQELIQKGDHFICKISNKEEIAEIKVRIPIIAHGSWEQGVNHTEQIKHKNTDLLAFKTHFAQSSLDLDLMPLFTFKGGYGGLVHTNNNRITFSCCVQRDVLQQIRIQNPGMQAGDAVCSHIRAHCEGVRQALASSIQEDSWLSVGPLRPGIRPGYQKGIFYLGNMAGEAHPLIAEGISMAMQSAWILTQSLLNKPSLNPHDLAKIGQNYAKKWRAQFATRIRAASVFQQLTTNPRFVSMIVPIVERYPGLLTYAARLGGKVKLYR